MTARSVIEHALRVYFADSADPNAVVDRLLANYDAERPFPPLWVADYDSAPLTLHLTREAARAACDDVATVDAHGQGWDWRTEGDDVDRQFWTNPDDDRPTGYTGGAVWQIAVEGSAKDTRGESPRTGESTHDQRHPRPCEYPELLPCQCPRTFERTARHARRSSRLRAYFLLSRRGRSDAAVQAGGTR